MKAALALLLSAGVAQAGILDDRLAAAEPCRDLPQLSETVAVAFEGATIAVLPDSAEIGIAGRLSCRSGAGALLQSDASVHIDARVWLGLDGCSATRSEVRLSDFGGSLGPVVEALAPELERSLAADVAGAAEDACRDLLD